MNLLIKEIIKCDLIGYAYVLWIMYVLSIVFLFVGMIGTLTNIFKKLKENK
jgi:hypothetical protein